MAYNPITWKDQIVTDPTKYKITKENGAEELVNIERVPGEIIQEGTRVTSDKLNNIEQGIKGATDLVGDLAGTGRTAETVKKNADDIGNLSTQMAELAQEFVTHKANNVAHVRVVDEFPSNNDGSFIYHKVDKLFYASRNGQWWRIYVGGDEKLDQDPPSEPPAMEHRTDTTIKLVSAENLEYKYEGGDWQESSLFTGLNRNTSYIFYSRYAETEVFKASQPSPSATFTTDKGTQIAPAAPTVSNIQLTSATVYGGSGTEVRIGTGAWYSSPHTFTGLSDNTSYIAYARKKETTTHHASPNSSGRSFVTLANIPGPQTIIAGNTQAGYYGEFSSLISGDSLALSLGITEGESINSTVEWLKFIHSGKLLFMPKMTLRGNISWEAIYKAGAVYGDGKLKGETGAVHHNTDGFVGSNTPVRQNAQIQIIGRTYKVRLVRGSGEDPRNMDIDGEWQDLIRLHGIGLDDEVLGSAGWGSGKYTWCQETSHLDSTERVRVTYSESSAEEASRKTYYGWRPVLELVE